MQIQKVIDKLKAYHKGEWEGKQIDEETTRDKVLYGNPYQECTGIVTTCWATIDVIKKAALQGANLIIAHEALFWNHGDHTDWLQEEENSTFLAKKKLLDETGIVVWRDHDYIHSGIPMNGGYVDGIFHGVMVTLGWEKYLSCDPARPMIFELPETPVKEIGRLIMEKFHLTGLKMLGNTEAKVRKVAIASHILGGDNDMITRIDQENIDLLISMELIDFTVSEYIRDSAMLGMPKAILAVGHFNTEEPGMEYMVHYIPEALGEAIPCRYIQSGDMYEFMIA